MPKPLRKPLLGVARKKKIAPPALEFRWFSCDLGCERWPSGHGYTFWKDKPSFHQRLGVWTNYKSQRVTCPKDFMQLLMKTYPKIALPAPGELVSLPLE